MRVPPAQIYFPPEDRAAILQQIDECLASGQLTLGKYGRELETQFAASLGVKHAIAVNSGTSAIEIPLRALGVEGREVLIQANTFFATAAAALAAGATVRFLECNPDTMAIDPADLRAQIGPRTAGVILVHIGGLVTPDVEQIKSICDERGVWLFEDAAHAQGSSHNGRMAGTFGVAGSFSFYPTKVMTAAEGGMIVTNDDRIADEARIYRDQGKASFLTNLHTRLGSNWRLSEPHAIIALSQLGRVDEFIRHRQHIAGIYNAALERLPLTPLFVPDDAGCNYYKYIAFLPDGVDRAALKQQLRTEFEIGLSGEVYDQPLNKQPVFADYADRALPGAERLCDRHICLPVSAVMTDEQAMYVVDALASALERIGTS
jgi:perosamine synthetase